MHGSLINITFMTFLVFLQVDVMLMLASRNICSTASVKAMNGSILAPTISLTWDQLNAYHKNICATDKTIVMTIQMKKIAFVDLVVFSAVGADPERVAKEQ